MDSESCSEMPKLKATNVGSGPTFEFDYELAETIPWSKRPSGPSAMNWKTLRSSVTTLRKCRTIQSHVAIGFRFSDR